jgi:hypothetical protein
MNTKKTAEKFLTCSTKMHVFTRAAARLLALEREFINRNFITAFVTLG